MLNYLKTKNITTNVSQYERSLHLITNNFSTSTVIIIDDILQDNPQLLPSMLKKNMNMEYIFCGIKLKVYINILHLMWFSMWLSVISLRK